MSKTSLGRAKFNSLSRAHASLADATARFHTQACCYIVVARSSSIFTLWWLTKGLRHWNDTLLLQILPSKCSDEVRPPVADKRSAPLEWQVLEPVPEQVCQSVLLLYCHAGIWESAQAHPPQKAFRGTYTCASEAISACTSECYAAEKQNTKNKKHKLKTTNIKN